MSLPKVYIYVAEIQHQRNMQHICLLTERFPVQTNIMLAQRKACQIRSTKIGREDMRQSTSIHLAAKNEYSETRLL